jgi:hypothetical protein
MVTRTAACSSPSQCVAVDDAGDEVNSVNPAGGQNAWTGAQVSVSTPSPVGGPTPSPLYAISCPAPSLCVAVDAWGNAFIGGATPSNLTPPSISGHAVVGQTLRETRGTWSDSPTSVDMFWERCDSIGADCLLIDAATGPTYTLSNADLGKTIRAVEVASNANGDGIPAESDQTAVVQQAAPMPQTPAITSPPGISGKPVQGQTLTETHGTWTNTPTGYRYQWERCSTAGTSCSTVTDASAQTYTVDAADVGHTIRVQETASDAAGPSAPAVSPATAVVTGPPATIAQIKALLSAAVTPHGKTARIAAIVKKGFYSATFNAPEAGTLTFAWYVVPKGAHLTKALGPQPVLVAEGRLTLAKAGTAKIKVTLTSTGRRVLRHATRVKLTGEDGFMPIGQAAVVSTKTFTLIR